MVAEGGEVLRRPGGHWDPLEGGLVAPLDGPGLARRPSRRAEEVDGGPAPEVVRTVKVLAGNGLLERSR